MAREIGVLGGGHVPLVDGKQINEQRSPSRIERSSPDCFLLSPSSSPQTSGVTRFDPRLLPTSGKSPRFQPNDEYARLQVERNGIMDAGSDAGLVQDVSAAHRGMRVRTT